MEDEKLEDEKLEDEKLEDEKLEDEKLVKLNEVSEVSEEGKNLAASGRQAVFGGEIRGS